MAPHSSILTQGIPRTEEPGGLESSGSQTVGYDWATNTFHFTYVSYNSQGLLDLWKYLTHFWGSHFLVSLTSISMYYHRTHALGSSNQFSSVQSLSRVQLFATPWTAAPQASLSITNSQSLPKSCPSSQWCHPTISSSVGPFSSCPQSLPGSFPMSQLFAWGGQSIGVSASASVLPMNTQDRSPLGWTSWISLQSKGLSKVFSNTTVQKHQFFGTQLSS